MKLNLTFAIILFGLRNLFISQLHEESIVTKWSNICIALVFTFVSLICVWYEGKFQGSAFLCIVSAPFTEPQFFLQFAVLVLSWIRFPHV